MLLLDRGANANHSDSQSWTPLHVASLEGRNDTVRLLLDHGADPEHQNSQGLAPHHIALRLGHVQTVQLLRDHAQGRGRITGIVMPGLHWVLHRGKVITSPSGYYSTRF
jgi:ankyrin repeat protein